MLDPNGYVSEGSGENIFIYSKGKLHTPALSCSNLDGITRDAVMEICKELGIGLKERNITRDELYIAEELFLSGTAAEITPVREVDSRIIGNGEKGPVTDKIQQTFFEIARGCNAKFSKWLTPV